MPQAIGIAIGAFLFNVGAPLIVVNAAVAFGGSLLLGAAAFGAQFLLRPNLQTPKGVRPSDGQSEIRAPLANRTKSFGRVRVSGAVWFYRARTARRLYKGLAVNHGRIGRYVSFHIDENLVELDESTGLVTSSPYGDVENYILFRMGNPVEVPYTDLPSRAAVTRGDGVATVLGIFQNPADSADHASMYPGGQPDLRVTIEASVCFDPREPLHDREDESTWEWSENAVVVVLNFLIDPDGHGMSWARIEPNLAEWVAAMDVCDEEVELSSGGTAKRYVIAGTYSFAERPTDVLARMLAACDGRIWQRRDGSIGVSVGRFVPPTVSIESKDILSYRIERGQDRLTAIAGVRAQYMSPDHDYREHEADPWPSGAAVIALEEDRVGTLDLSWVPARAQTRRLMKREYVRQTAEWRGEISTNLAGLRAIDERFITLAIDELGIEETFEVQRFTLDPTRMSCQLEVLSVGAEIDEWDPESEEGSFEAGFTFGFDSFFSKTGTDVDPLAEAGAVTGQTAIVFCASSSTIPTGPAGWTEITRVGPTSSIAMAAYLRVLDGTETAATFLTATGVIIVAKLDGAPFPVPNGISTEISTSIGGEDHSGCAAPWAVFAFAVRNATSITDDLNTFAYDGSDEITEAYPETRVSQSNGTFTGVVAVRVVPPETADSPTVVTNVSDVGTSGMLEFALTVT